MKTVVVVGGGIIGLCSARFLAEAGHEVIVLDAEGSDFERCSDGNSGMIVPSHVVPLAAPGMVGYGLRMLLRPGSPFGISHVSPDLAKWAAGFMKAANPAHTELAAPMLHRLHSESLAIYMKWCGELGVDLNRRGLAMLCLSHEALDREIAAAEEASKFGVEHVVHGQSALLELDPGVDCSAVGAVHYPGDAWLDPSAFCNRLRESLAKKVHFRWLTPCTGIETAGTKVRAVITQGGQRIAGDEFLFATGAWLAEAGQWLGTNLPMVSGKGYSVTLANPPRTPSVCSLWPEFRVACTPMASGLRFGGTMELGTPNFRTTRSRVEGIFDAVRKMFPTFESYEFEAERIWVGNRPCTPDGLAYLGRLSNWENVVIAAGHAMMGLSLGPISGQLAAEAIDGADQIHLLNPNRYV